MPYHILPYIETKNGWSISDEHMEWVFTRMLKEGLVKKTFPGGRAVTHFEWMELVRSPINIVSLITDENGLLAVSWLNGFERNHAWIHFCVFRTAWGKQSVEIGKLAVKSWFENIPPLDVLLGRTPSDNRLAVAYIKKVGMRISGTLPMIGFDIYRNKKTDIVLSYIKRGDV